jgi:hypothetical protein
VNQVKCTARLPKHRCGVMPRAAAKLTAAAGNSQGPRRLYNAVRSPMEWEDQGWCGPSLPGWFGRGICPLASALDGIGVSVKSRRVPCQDVLVSAMAAHIGRVSESWAIGATSASRVARPCRTLDKSRGTR